MSDAFRGRKCVDFADEDECWACGSDAKIEMHHIHPRSALGSDHPDNLIPLCFICHSLVDRVPLAKWPIEDLISSFAAMTGGPTVTKRLVLKMMSIAFNASKQGNGQ